jgi:choline-sulfatase
MRHNEPRPSRRDFLCGATGTLLAGADAAPVRNPNILWIVADDHAAAISGVYGSSSARTPSLDRFAAGATRFTQAFCCSPVCTAARQAFLTGRYPRSIGVTQLASVLPAGERTFAHELSDAGYDTAAFGKMHFNSDLKHGFAEHLDLPEFALHAKVAQKRPIPGDIKVQPPWKPFIDPASIWLNSDCRPFAYYAADTSAEYFASQAEQFFQRPRENPFFLVAGFYEPHSPYNFPVEYRNRHKSEEFVAPKVQAADVSQIPIVFKDLTDAQKRGSIAAYHTSVEFLDSQIGRVLEALDQSGHADNTIVVYLSDHGYLLGEHGRFEKHSGFDPAIRVPLIIRDPRRAKAGISSSVVQTFDLVPTLLEMCGLPIPVRIQGKSFLSTLNDPTRAHRDAAIIEYSENAEAYIRTDRWKFIYCAGTRARQDGYVTANPMPGPYMRLYDRDADPDELNNLAGNPEHAKRIAAFSDQLLEHLTMTAREPIKAPANADLTTLLDRYLQPNDIPLPRLATRPMPTTHPATR